MFKSKNISKDVTFASSMNIPFQRWYPYIEGYSPNFVLNIINQYCPNPTLVYEPFAGTGTTLFAADSIGCDCEYSEINPLLRYIIEIKLRILSLEPKTRTALAQQLQDYSDRITQELSGYAPSRDLSTNYQQTFGQSKYFNDDTYDKILRLRTYIDNITVDNADIANLLTIATLSSLVPTSLLKKQGDVRYKNEKELKAMPVFDEFLRERINIISEDLFHYHYQLNAHQKMICKNAKEIGTVKVTKKFSSVITSPPYLNGTNYFRNTKLELWFLRQLTTKEDLRSYRDAVLTSGINDVKLNTGKANSISDSLLAHTINELRQRSYDRRIQEMVSCYFDEMFTLFAGLTKHLETGACVAIDIGDSVFAGVHVKTDDILINILDSLGYKFQEKVLLRNRRSHNGQLLSQVLIVLEYRG